MIRPATDADRRWVDAAHRSLGFPVSGPEDVVLVAVEGEAPAGVGRLVPQEDGSVELGGMYVDPAWRGRGVAGALVRALLGVAGERTVWCLPLSPLVGWYQGFGLAPGDPGEAPAAVAEKLAWCRATFPEGVELLVRR